MRLVDVQCKPLQCWCVQVAGVARICHGNNSPLSAFGQEFCRPAAPQPGGWGSLCRNVETGEKSINLQSQILSSSQVSDWRLCDVDVETNCCSAWDNTNLMLVNITITTPCTVIVFSTLDYRTATAFN